MVKYAIIIQHGGKDMFIIVVGQGKVGTTLASQLCAEGHDIVIIDSNPEVLKKLQETLEVTTL